MTNQLKISVLLFPPLYTKAVYIPHAAVGQVLLDCVLAHQYHYASESPHFDKILSLLLCTGCQRLVSLGWCNGRSVKSEGAIDTVWKSVV